MSEATPSKGINYRDLGKKEIFSKFSPIARYHLRWALLLAAVPLACSSVLFLLFLIFAKLNLFYVETIGFVLDQQARDGYFRQVEMEALGVLGYLFLQIIVTFLVALVVMRWATAPFASAEKMIQTALKYPEKMKPLARWASESPQFDRIMWLFALRVKSGGENQVKEDFKEYGMNIPFLAKFVLVFGTLSVSMGYVMSIILISVFERVVQLAIQLANARKFSPHFFTAQQEVLRDGATLAMGISFALYVVLGFLLSRYMGTMLYVFSRTVKDDNFPLKLRGNDIYHDLAKTMNQAGSSIAKRV
jgi:hypothetical protein